MGVAHAGQFEDVALVVSRDLFRTRESADLVVILGDGPLLGSCLSRSPSVFRDL